MNRTTRIRILSAVLSVLLAAPAVFSPAQAVASSPGPTFTITGTGWGHGIGLSQYGAYGSALAGMSYRQILAHYYSGTTVEKVSIPKVKVNIDTAFRPGVSYAGRTSWTMLSVGSTLAARRIGSSTTALTLKANTFYRFTTNGSVVIVATEGGTEVGRVSGDVVLATTGGSRLIQVKDATNVSSNVRYRGEMQITRVGTRLAAVNELTMQQYLYGVVPHEMPASWHAEALKAQSVAARSYGYADVAAGRVLACTTWSQVYRGHSRVSSGSVIMHEESRTNTAVNDTNGQVIKYGSRVVQAFFFSQSGGHTASNEDVWVSGTARPELRGVPDPHERLGKPTLSPWPTEIKMTGLEIAGKLRGLSGVPTSTSTYVTSVSFDRASSHHVRYATFRFSNGASARLTGDSVRSRLGLRSTHFYMMGFPIQRIEGATRYSTAVEVSKRAFPGTAGAVVLATGQNHPDALAGSALAGTVNAPILLTRTASLPSVTRSELRRLSPSTVYIMGGPRAINGDVEAAVRAALPSARVERVQGQTMYDTALDAANRVAASVAVDKVLIVGGSAWPDGAAVSPIAYSGRYPVLLVRQDDIGEGVQAFLELYKPSTALIIGGPQVVSEGVEAAVAATGSRVQRLAGSNRYHTAAAVARYAIASEGFAAGEVYIATGTDFPDALTGGVLAGKKKNPLLLTHTNGCPAGPTAFLNDHKPAIKRLNLFGGHLAISPAGMNALDSVLMR